MLRRASWHTSDENLVSGLLICMFFQALYMNYAVLSQDPVWDLLIVYGIHWTMLVLYAYLFFIRQRLSATIILVVVKGILLFMIAFNFMFDAEWSTLYLLPYLAWSVYFAAINIFITDKNSEVEKKHFLEWRASDYTRDSSY